MSKLSKALGININLLRLIPKAIQQAIVNTALDAAKPQLIALVNEQAETYIDPAVLKTAITTTIDSWQIKV